MRPDFARREPPLPPDAVAAAGAARRGLIAATATKLKADVELRVCLSEDWLVVLGAAADLPWSDGVAYLAWQEGVLLPTTVRALPSPDLLRRALAARAPAGHRLLAVVDEQVLTAPLPQRTATTAHLLYEAGS